MKIKDIIYKTPEMSEEKLLKIINSHLDWIKKDLKSRVIELHKSNDKPFDLAELCGKTSFIIQRLNDMPLLFFCFSSF